MNCSNCGAAIPENMHVCPICSTSNNTSNSVNTMNIKNNKKGFKLNSKLIIIAILGIVVLALIAFVILKFFGSSSKVDLSSLDQDTPILVKKDGKYGYINTNGKFIIEPKYNYAGNFNYGLAVVETDDYKAQIIDTKGKTKLEISSRYGIDYDQESGTWVLNSQLYDSSFKKLSNDKLTISRISGSYFKWVDYEAKKAGIMNANGKVTYLINLASEKDSLYISSYRSSGGLKESYCVLNNNKKYAIVNCSNGKVVKDFSDDVISAYDNNIFKISTKDNASFISYVYISNNKIQYEVTDKQVSMTYADGYLVLYDSSKDYDKRTSYYDLKAKKVIDELPKSVKNKAKYLDPKQLINFSCGSYEGLIRNNKVILNCEWDDVLQLKPLVYEYLKSNGKDYVVVEDDDCYYLMSIKNKKKVLKLGKSVTYYENSLFVKSNGSEDTYTVYNLLTLKSSNLSGEMQAYSNYLTVSHDNVKDYYNNKLKLIYTEK